MIQASLDTKGYLSLKKKKKKKKKRLSWAGKMVMGEKSYHTNSTT
jgi:hypothetical protein